MTRDPFKGTINVDIKTQPGKFGVIKRVVVDISGEPYVDMARAAEAMLVRE